MKCLLPSSRLAPVFPHLSSLYPPLPLIRPPRGSSSPFLTHFRCSPLSSYVRRPLLLSSADSAAAVIKQHAGTRVSAVRLHQQENLKGGGGGGMLLREPNQHLWEVFMGRQEDESENPLGCWCLKGPRFKGQSSPITEMRIIWFGEPELVRLSSWPVGCVYLPEAALAQDHEEVEVVDPHSDWDRDGDVERRAGWGGGGLGQNRGEGLRQRDRQGLRQRGGRHIWLGLLENSSGRTGR